MTVTTYGGQRLSPAPQINISAEPYYSGDIIIGYTYNVNIKGYATAYRKTNDTDNPTHSIVNFGLVVGNIGIVKNALTNNGADLLVVDGSSQVLKAKGGILRSLSFNESPNNWMGYAEYTADIEFNEIELVNGTSLKTINCSDSYLDAQSKSSSIVDISKYKLKSFTDSWSINIDDNIYNRIRNTDMNLDIDTDNSRMNVSYTISATGKNFYVSGSVKPAWEQAKNFAQERLFNQVNNLLVSSLGIDGDNACSASKNLSELGSSSDGALKELNNLYQVYNETISCETSESEGTFSATYNAIIKRNKTSSTNHPASIHTFNKSINTQNDPKKTVTISIQGNIEGLIEGGIIRAAGSGFSLPANGSILISSIKQDKYTQALTALNKIISNSDLTLDFKNKLGINMANLGFVNSQLTNCSNITPDLIKPLSFNLTHNYHEGTISYNIEYSSNRACGTAGGSFSNISISVENPTPVLAELTLPRSGVLIQDLGTKTAKKINITIEGKGNRNCCLGPAALVTAITNATTFNIPAGVNLPDMNNYLLTQKQRTDNPIDGSYTINLTYLCVPGCNI
jgi:hypothetical protein